MEIKKIRLGVGARPKFYYVDPPLMSFHLKMKDVLLESCEYQNHLYFFEKNLDIVRISFI